MAGTDQYVTHILFASEPYSLIPIADEIRRQCIAVRLFKPSFDFFGDIDVSGCVDGTFVSVLARGR